MVSLFEITFRLRPSVIKTTNIPDWEIFRQINNDIRYHYLKIFQLFRLMCGKECRF